MHATTAYMYVTLCRPVERETPESEQNQHFVM